MQNDNPIIRPPAQGGLAYVEPAKRLQQWLQGRGRSGRRAGSFQNILGPGD
ncbi:MAG: hypothetical protein JWQ16_1099 [Novosphingobium sp.]|nr:hypothetical protein [Novosphingobium sp.]